MNEMQFKLSADKETVQIISGQRFSVVALVGKWSGKQVSGNCNFDDAAVSAAIAYAKSQLVFN